MERLADVIVYLIGSRVEINGNIGGVGWCTVVFLNKDSIVEGFFWGSGNKYLYLYLLE